MADIPDDFCNGRANGKYPHPDDPTKYVKCSNGYAYEYKCPADLVFNPDTLDCDWPENVDRT